jgi:hypothetical protein
MSAQERQAIRRAAKRAHVSTSVWARSVLLAALRGRFGVALLAGLLATASACSSPPIRPLPLVPAVQTDAGSLCVQRCQQLYNDCMRLTLRVVPGAFSPVTEYDAAGLDACRENLGGCYGTCR